MKAARRLQAKERWVCPAMGSGHRDLVLGREEQSPAPSSNYSGLLRFLRRRTRAYAPARARNGSPAPAIGPGAPADPFDPPFPQPPPGVSEGLSAKAGVTAAAQHSTAAARRAFCKECRCISFLSNLKI